MTRLATLLCSTLLLFSTAPLYAGEAKSAVKPAYDAALAQRLGADAHGMRKYVLVVLKTGPKRMPDGPERDAMFKGHFANINRLADAGQLAVAGPFGKGGDWRGLFVLFANINRLADAGQLAVAGPFGKGGDWRGLFVLAVTTVEEAEKLVVTDPVIQHGEMVAEFHPWYGSAAVMQVPEIHTRITAPTP